ncbi:hypothetical protein CHARACLAT_012766 [Characodon lateralis]|uniref:Uncharacterized protein n=1 Tax=Characodon lateralis TaxID=208331 RepID=A0ABU7E9W6_9TELE|nr:hypothetical protein [Characodon lateralis]
MPTRALCVCEEGSAVPGLLMKRSFRMIECIQLTISLHHSGISRGDDFCHLTLGWVFALSPSVMSQGGIVVFTASVRQQQYQLRSIWHYLHLITQEGLCLLFGAIAATILVLEKLHCVDFSSRYVVEIRNRNLLTQN